MSMSGLAKRLDKLEQQRHPRGRLLVHDTRNGRDALTLDTLNGEPIDPATVTPADMVLRVVHDR